MEPAHIGHVSRSRLLEPGSVAARQYARALSEVPDSQGGGDDEEEPAQITWPELWDARLLAGNVAQSMAAAAASDQGIGTAWPHTGQQQKVARHIVQYSRTLAGVRSNKRRRTDDADGEHPKATVQDGAVMPEDLPPAAPPVPMKPWRCRCALKTCGAADGAQPRVCGYLNKFCMDRCAACDAPRWDGAHGQLHARVAATLQTADLDATSVKQLQRRVVGEQASQSGVGLVCTTEDVARLVQRYLSKHSAHGAHEHAPSAQGTAEDGQLTGDRRSPDNLVDDELMQQMDCPPEATGVRNVLLAMLQQQRQQQQPVQEQGEEHEARPSGSPAPTEQEGVQLLQQQQHLAAHLAACGTVLLKALVQPHIDRTRREYHKRKMVVGTRGQWHLHPAAKGHVELVKWLGQRLDRGFLGQEQDSTPGHDDESDAADPPAECPKPLLRGLPPATIATMLDPITSTSWAVLHAFARQGRRLPRVSRIYSSQAGEELGQDVMLPSQWLFRRAFRGSKAGRTCKGRRAARFSGDVGIPVVVQRQANWHDVEGAMGQVQKLLSEHSPVDEATVLAAWASSPPWKLRRRLPGMPLPSWAGRGADSGGEHGQGSVTDGDASTDGSGGPGRTGQAERALGSSVWRPYATAGAGGPDNRPLTADTLSAGAVASAASVDGADELPQGVQDVLHAALALGVRKAVLDKAATRLRLLCNNS